MAAILQWIWKTRQAQLRDDAELLELTENVRRLQLEAREVNQQAGQSPTQQDPQNNENQPAPQLPTQQDQARPAGKFCLSKF